MTASPPEHLSAASRDWFAMVTEEFALEPWQLRTLAAAAEAHDRMTEARIAIDADGPTITTRFGELRAHPLLAVERDSRTAYLRAVRELALDVGPPDPRPRRSAGR